MLGSFLEVSRVYPDTVKRVLGFGLGILPGGIQGLGLDMVGDTLSP